MDFLKPFSFTLKTKIEFGADARKKLPGLLADLNGHRLLVVTDQRIEKQQWFKELIFLLEEKGYAASIYDKVEGNPKDRNAEEAAEQARAFRANIVLAVGGGSPIDCAKAAAVLALQGGRARDYENPERIGPNVLPIAALPTTAGTGSEVTLSSVITDTKEHFKFTIKASGTAPKLAVLDPAVTCSMPRELTAATGMDALTHAVEAFSSRASEPIADACALRAAELIAGYLPRAYDHGDDLTARSAVLLGSLLAGIAFSHADVGAVHCIAEALGGMYDLPHGVCNAVCLPVVMEYCGSACREQYARLSTAMNSGDGNVALPEKAGAVDAVECVKRLSGRVNLPGFASFNVPESDFPLIAAKAAANGSNKNNIPVLQEADYLQILHLLKDTS